MDDQNFMMLHKSVPLPARLDRMEADVAAQIGLLARATTRGRTALALVAPLALLAGGLFGSGGPVSGPTRYAGFVQVDGDGALAPSALLDI